MRLIAVGCCIVILSFMTAVAGVARATEQDTFNRAVAKYAPPFDLAFALDRALRTKALCVCREGLPPSLAPGFLYQETGTDRIVCALPVFLPDGTFADAAFPCFEYQILAK